ncbi:MAG: inorganic pyrophosphatase Ppa [Spirochaetes bacterium]|nr:inorganic pyrophosphatase Ppa [Spirochaetota bacterium]
MAKHEIVKSEIFSLEKLDYSQVSKTECVSFTGSPSKHPYDPEKFILVRDPLSDHTDFIEFQKSDVLYVKELPHIFSEDEKTINMCRVWIRSGVVALKIQPFIVGKAKVDMDELLR